MAMTLQEKQALEKTEEILNALEAIRGRVGILETNMGVVWDVFHYGKRFAMYGENEEEGYLRVRRRRRPRRRAPARKAAKKK